MSESTSTDFVQPALRIYRVLERFWECVGLSLLWALGCLPLVTAGASTAALFAVVGQRIQGDYRPVFRSFWGEFRRAPLARAAVTVVVLLALFGATQILLAGMGMADPVRAMVIQAVALSGFAAVLGTLVTALPLRAGQIWSGRVSTDRGGSGLATLRLAVAVGLGRPLTTLAAALLTAAAMVAVILSPPLLLVLGWVWARLVTALHESAWRSLSRRGRSNGQVLT